MDKHQKVPKEIRGVCEFFGGLALVSVALISAPIVIPLACISADRKFKAQDEVANRTLCEKCQQLLGTASIELADKIKAESRAKTMAAMPGHRIRFVDRWQVVCTNCRAGHFYDEKTRAFTFVEIVEEFSGS